MRKIKNKKMATVVVAFLMVFVMAGAFAAFQALLDIRARVNLFTPTVDAVFATFALGADYIEDDITDDGVLMTGGWTGPNFNDPATTGRELPTPLSTQILPSASQQVPHVAGLDYGGENAWSFNWGTAGRVGPTAAFLNAGGVNVRENQTIYVQVAFDTFSQAVEFDFSLANQGPVPLRIDNVVVEPVAATVVGADWTSPFNVTDLIDDRATATWSNFVTISGMFSEVYNTTVFETTGVPRGTVAVAHPDAANNTQRFGLEGFVMPEVNDNTENRSPLTNIRFFVTPAQWDLWAETLSEADMDEAEIYSRDLTFRITYTVVPEL